MKIRESACIACLIALQRVLSAFLGVGLTLDAAMSVCKRSYSMDTLWNAGESPSYRVEIPLLHQEKCATLTQTRKA